MPAINEKNIAVVCNPIAGSGRAVTVAANIAAALSAQAIPFTIFKETWPANFDGFTDVFIAGGDGTINYFINQYPLLQLPLVLFSGGTGNDFHWLLYGTATFEEQLHIALHEPAKPIDLGRCNNCYFINGVGIGFEGEVARALTGKKKFSGKTSFLITIIKKIFSYRCRNYTIRSNEFTCNGKKLLVDITNGKRAGGGFHIAPTAKANDGLLDVVIADALTVAARLRYLPVIEKGKHLNLSFIKHFQTTRITIESDMPLQYHLDGEYLESIALTIELLPGKLHFRY
jgi:diacylglycerol kinase (ATP)